MKRPRLTRPRRWVRNNRSELVISILVGTWFVLAVAAFLALVFWARDLLP